MKQLLILCLCAISTGLFAQGVGINATGAPADASAGLDVSFNDKGLLPPRLTEAQRDAISNPANGLMIYNTDTDCYNMWNGSTWRQSCYECDFSAPTVGNNSPLCEGGTVNLTASTISGATYSWTGPNGFSSSQQNPSIAGATTAASGIYSLQVTLNGCTGTPVTTTVTVNGTPATPTAGNDGPACAGTTVNLTASNIVGATYAWTGPNGYSSNLQNPQLTNVSVSSSGTYSVIATIAGCPGAAGTTNVTVNAIPATPTAGSNSPLCSGDDLNLTASTVSGATYSWTGPNAYTSTDQNPTITGATPTNAGTYTVVAIANGCSSAGSSTVVVVNGGGGSGSQTFSYTGGLQYFEVPANVCKLTIEVWGAQGALNQSNVQGALGARMKGDFTLLTGDSLVILVGGQGTKSPSANSSSGGGGSFVALIDANSSDVMFNGKKVTPLIIAGGGGGVGGSGSAAGVAGSTGTSGTLDTYGQGQPGTSGGGGISGSISNVNGGGGGGGFLLPGLPKQSNSGYPGQSFLQGAAGGSSRDGNSFGGYGGGGGNHETSGGGGGGGGYSGGTGGQYTGSYGGGGGGGSYNDGTNQSNTGGVRSGHGQVSITW